MILVYHVLHGRFNLPQEAFFTKSTLQSTRGHPLKLAKPHAQTRVRKNHWSIKVVNDWNSLPDDIVMAETLNEFKNKIDKHWSKYKYEHP